MGYRFVLFIYKSTYFIAIITLLGPVKGIKFLITELFIGSVPEHIEKTKQKLNI